MCSYTLALSFLTESALRMHPIEWTTGTSAGVIAAFMVRRGAHDTAALMDEATMVELQGWLRRHTPLEWTIDGKTWPNL